MGMGRLGRRDDCIHVVRDRRRRYCAYGIVEQERMLRDNADLGAQRFNRKIANVDAIDQDAADLHHRNAELDRPAYSSRRRSFPPCDHLPRLHREIDIFQYRGFA
jgi:hypothetical protein